MDSSDRADLSTEKLLGEIRILWDRIRALEAANYALKFDHKTKALRGDLSADEIAGVYAHATKYHLSLTIMLVDLDDFKLAQDSRSHLWGDAVLAGTVADIHAHLRTYDLIFRYGAGDEFLIMMTGLSLELAHVVRARLEQVLAQRTVSADGYNGQVSATLGLAFASQAPFEDLIKQADQDLKERKREKKVGR